MCLAIPGQVIALDTETMDAEIDYDGLRRRASARLLPDVQIGDYVLVHAGFIIQRLNEDEGSELAELAREVGFYDD